MTARQVPLLAALLGLAVFAWLVPASMHIVSWPAAGPVRLALLSPTWQLLVWLAAATVLFGALRLTGRADAGARLLFPFNIVWLVAVPYLPWLPDRLPLLLLLAGEIRWVLLAVAAVRALLLWRGDAGITSAAGAVGRRTVFIASLVVYLAFGLWSVSTNGLGGDEPHYLIISESLLRDHDLDIENNHQRGDYRSFFRGDLRPDYMQRGLNGVLYSIHAPGLPAVLLPAYVAGGYRGAVAFIALMAALTALAVYDLAALVAGPLAALLTWMAVCLSVPFIPHAWAIFPEMPGALLVAWASLWLAKDPASAGAGRWAMRGVALALLPWLHTKFIVFLAIYSLGLGLRMLRQLPRLVALALPIAASCALWLYSFYAMYGKLDPEAPYGAYSRVFVLTKNIPHGLLGLFLDQKFGLLVYSPIYLAAIAGAWFGLRDTRWRYPSLVLLATVAAFVGSTARLYMFWGGSSAPARFFVPVLPCLAPFVALALARAQSMLARAAVGTWLALSVGIAAFGIASPERLMLFSDPHGRARLLEFFQAGSPLALVVPTFTDPDWESHVWPLVLWLGATALGGAALWLASRIARSPWTLSAAGAITFLVAGAVFTAHPAAAVREATALRGDLDVLWAFDGDRFRTLDYASLARTTPDRLRELTTLRLTPRVPADAKGPYELGPLELPPGTFDASVWFNGRAARSGEVSVAGPRATFGALTGTLDNPATFPVTLPVAGRRVMVRITDLGVARAATEVRLVPRDIVPPPARDPRPVRAVEGLPGPAGAYLVYTDGDAYPEMGTFWSRGTAATTVLVAPAGAARMTLTLSTGPMAGTVVVTTPAGRQSFAMQAGVDQQVSIALPQGARLVPLTIQSSVMFRPGEITTESRDFRGLGCQVRIALE
ncbi:MAG: hypothetical protein U0Q55_03905 [Vicinamibacterales bacterium]